MNMVPDSEAVSRSRPAVKARCRWAWLRRIVLAVAVLALAAAVLPPLTSGRRLAGLIADHIAGTIKLPVEIGSATWGWWSGLELKDFRTEFGESGQVAVEG